MSRYKFNSEDTITAVGELLRKHGYHGTTLSLIKDSTGLGKGSFYHHFPQGKEEIARIVLDDVQVWFEGNVFKPLEEPPYTVDSIENMYKKTAEFFSYGNRICLPGSFSLYDARDIFLSEVHFYFKRWIEALTLNLKKQGLSAKESKEAARDAVAAIQGAIVLSRALSDPVIFEKTLENSKQNVLNKIKNSSS